MGGFSAMGPALTLCPHPSPLPACTGDSLSISKSPPCKNSFGIENSLSTSSEVLPPVHLGPGLGSQLLKPASPG